MRTLHVGVRVGDPDRSIGFYRALGYEIVGRVAGTPIGDLTMLKLPDDEWVTIELVHDPVRHPAPGAGPSHLVVQVDSMTKTLDRLAERGIAADAPNSPDETKDFLTTHVRDPDGNTIELVQWPRDHGAGMSAADFDP